MLKSLLEFYFQKRLSEYNFLCANKRVILLPKVFLFKKKLCGMLGAIKAKNMKVGWGAFGQGVEAQGFLNYAADSEAGELSADFSSTSDCIVAGWVLCSWPLVNSRTCPFIFLNM